ncbi:nucleotidyltransferase domain-containing protein [Clostridium oryzae]|uniref:nucleotidyltransferase domain-containing protein n=1 Tax=Clostridium oryzae TaxID=1450648 RepID=UPI00111767EE|nr:nucleotidyltransferase domain-containing protein [Clostridium oryzae]
MSNSILQYQKAFNNIVEKLKNNEDILAVLVFGSMVTGDLWKESDIDLFVVVKNGPDTVENIYTEEKGIPLHLKFLNKQAFTDMYENNAGGGFIHRVLASSRLVFSKDIDITSTYNSGRYYQDFDRERWNIVYFSRLLNNIDLCKKYLSSGREYTAYIFSMMCIDDYSRLYVNYSGHMISRDALSVALNLNDTLKIYVDKFLLDKDETVENRINGLLDYINQEIDDNIKTITGFLIEYMQKSEVKMSSEQIKRDELFRSFDIDMEEILNELYKRNIIKKDTRDLCIGTTEVILKENVYYI